MWNLLEQWRAQFFFLWQHSVICLTPWRGSYTWKRLGKPLNMEKTLAENGMEETVQPVVVISWQEQVLGRVGSHFGRPSQFFFGGEWNWFILLFLPQKKVEGWDVHQGYFQGDMTPNHPKPMLSPARTRSLPRRFCLQRRMSTGALQAVQVDTGRIY